MITGILKNDSAGTTRLLEQNLNEAQLSLVFKAYADCCEQLAIQQEVRLRPEGQSFNPRPARILQILMQDARIFQADIMCSALEALSDPNESEDISVVQAVILLDDIRHFKLYGISKEVLLDKYKVLVRADGFELLELGLRKKIESAQRLYLRNH